MASKLGIGSVLDTMEFVRKAWGGLGQMPGSLQPTVDVKEIEKRIADLKAVEQWLNLNLSMLRGTVQALEVQMATINAMKSLGQSILPETLSTAVGQTIAQGVDTAAGAVKKTRSARKKVTKVVDTATAPVAWWSMLQKQFNDVTQSALAGGLNQARTGANVRAASPASAKKSTAKSSVKRRSGKKSST